MEAKGVRPYKQGSKPGQKQLDMADMRDMLGYIVLIQEEEPAVSSLVAQGPRRGL